MKKPHHTAACFKQHLVSIAKIVTATGYSRSCISHVLTGILSPSAALDAALHRYARQVAHPSPFRPKLFSDSGNRKARCTRAGFTWGMERVFPFPESGAIHE